VSGLDYANNRYYSNAYGRFMTPDPYKGNGGPQDPGSWNRYAYTRGDPANRNDPSGLCDSDDPSCVSQCDPADPICVAANSCDPADASCSLGSTGGGTGGSSSLPGSITYPLNGGPGDIGSLTVSLTGGGFTFQFADAADGALILGACAAQPEACVILGGVLLTVYITAQNWSTFSQAVQNTYQASRQKNWSVTCYFHVIGQPNHQAGAKQRSSRPTMTARKRSREQHVMLQVRRRSDLQAGKSNIGTSGSFLKTSRQSSGLI
jgi:RHS repeat-associated protein